MTDYFERYESYTAFEDWDRQHPDPLHELAVDNVRRRKFLPFAETVSNQSAFSNCTKSGSS